jgi:hypothetical protein
MMLSLARAGVLAFMLGLASPAAGELVMSTGELAPLYDTAAGQPRPGNLVYLYPGLALEPWPDRDGRAADAGLPYATATGLVVLASPRRLLTASQVRALSRDLGSEAGFLVEGVVATVRIDGAERTIGLGQGEGYRIVARRVDTTVLAVDLCDLAWEDLRDCWDADTPRLMQPIRAPTRAVAVVDLGHITPRREFAPAAELYRAGELTGLQQACGESTWRALGPDGPVADATPLLRALEADGFTLPDRYNGEAAVRLTFFATPEGRFRELEQRRGCAGPAPLRFILDDGQGRRAIVDEDLATALGLGLDAASGRPVVGCAAEFWRVFDAVRAQGLAAQDAHLLLAYSLAWADPHWLRCSAPQGALDTTASRALRVSR